MSVCVVCAWLAVYVHPPEAHRLSCASRERQRVVTCTTRRVGTPRMRPMQRCAAQVLPTTRHLMSRAIATRAVAPRAVPAALRPAFGALLPSQARRALSSAPHPEMEDLNTEFAEARYALADAEESVGTTYFSDDLEDVPISTDKVCTAAAVRPIPIISSPRSRHLAELATRHSQVLERYEAMKESLPEGSDARIELHSRLSKAASWRCPGSLALASRRELSWLLAAPRTRPEPPRRAGPDGRAAQGPLPDGRAVRPGQSGRFCASHQWGVRLTLTLTPNPSPVTTQAEERGAED